MVPLVAVVFASGLMVLGFDQQPAWLIGLAAATMYSTVLLVLKVVDTP